MSKYTGKRIAFKAEIPKNKVNNSYSHCPCCTAISLHKDVGTEENVKCKYCDLEYTAIAKTSQKEIMESTPYILGYGVQCENCGYLFTIDEEETKTGTIVVCKECDQQIRSLGL